MSVLTLLPIVFRSLLNRRVTAFLTVLSIAISVTLFLGVEKIRAGAQAGFASTVSDTDLIVGARSGAINLLLYSVFRIGDATNNVTWDTYQQIAARPDVAWAIPISLGDSHRGYRVVGTTSAYFEHYRTGDRLPLAMEAGQPFENLFEAVIGADVAEALSYTIGQEVIIAHGIGAVSFASHDNLPFRVVGILKRTGTPVDRSVHVSLAAIEAIHQGWGGGAAPRGRDRLSASEVEALDLEPQSITAFLLGLKSRIAVLRAQREINAYRQEPLLAIIPGVALTQLWDVVSVAETALSGIAAFVILTGLFGLMTNILTSLNERRREMAILRSVGASALHVFVLLVSEAVLLAAAGAVLGLVLVQLVIFVAAPLVVEATGVHIGQAGVTFFDLKTMGGVILLGGILAALPAWRAYRQSLADGLTVRL